MDRFYWRHTDEIIDRNYSQCEGCGHEEIQLDHKTGAYVFDGKQSNTEPYAVASTDDAAEIIARALNHWHKTRTPGGVAKVVPVDVNQQSAARQQ